MANILLSSIKDGAQYMTVITRQLNDNKAGLHVEAVRDDCMIVRISKKFAGVSDDALVALANEGRIVTAHQIAETRSQVERKENSIGLLFAKVPLIGAIAE